MSKARMCQRFYCDRRGDRYCCRDCPRSIICANPCMNHPARCGLEDKTGRVRSFGVSHGRDDGGED